MQMESAFKRLFKDYFGLFTDKTRDYLQAAYITRANCGVYVLPPYLHSEIAFPSVEF